MTTTICASNPVSTGDKTVQTPTDSCDRNAESVHALVVLARDGDDAAWELLFRRSYPRLLAYATRRLPTAEMAKDAVSETMTRAVANIARLRFDGAGFDAWMYGIARYVVIDAQRKMRREAPGIVPDTADTRPLPSDQALQGEDTDEVRAAFAQLNSTDQEVLELRVVANLSVEEVSSVLGRRPGAVRMAQSRALDRLRTIMLRKERERCRV